MSFALPILDSAGPVRSTDDSAALLSLLLREQQATAVESFSRWHDREAATSGIAAPASESRYRRLLPAGAPNAGQQYAFEVELDGCSGCKACVVACHNLNGLEEDELWRSVGMLHGGSSSTPVVQHVTAACHHCLEPACLSGCPVDAYEKDPLTGIVHHLDDQCIGCQYCILKCPYDVPKYSRAKGIVRKCDMCSQRLAVGEAPACVQACPNEAIRITIVDRHESAENAEANLFLPGAPEPGYTLPTTIYKTRRPLPANLLPADYYSAAPQHAHWPLVLMLVLTQMSVGAFAIDQIFAMTLGAARDGGGTPASILRVIAAFVLGLIGICGSVFHLGRPWLAYRAILGWRTSWLSREVLAFGLFAALASVYAAATWFSGWTDASDSQLSMIVRLLGVAVVVSGLAGVACSVMIYASTRRTFWNPACTGLKFLLSCLVLGIPTAMLLNLLLSSLSTAEHFALTAQSIQRWPSLVLLAAVTPKLALEATAFRWLAARTFTPMRRTALLMTGPLARATGWRFITGVGGGMLLPALLVVRSSSNASSAPLLVAAVVGGMLLLSFTGELLERYLFFAAVVAPKMPGAPAA